ncbi:nitrous oxide reductase accessory protein NosL [Marivirga sp. S37H4]|uniref:Nitrous oxide reductase accessory protein NosL n=1 Tax=Marivirga aurantiaca TaxID=2802615 RepID=A0A934WY55_9BACT|nr:nitrous oxide reductase accessory protein NosL [Marivirga aurantiaca]MBK6264950.1 nitrous oxide reductase accessory protein NosL [Marivirga aurantiaca]
MKYLQNLMLILIFISFQSCTPKPEPIAFGTDHCVYCKMGIVDPKYGGELVTEKARVFKFDAVECMLPFMKENPDQKYAYILVLSYDDPAELHNVEELVFVQSEKYKSPMGGNIAAFLSQENTMTDDGLVMTWPELKKELKSVPIN